MIVSCARERPVDHDRDLLGAVGRPLDRGQLGGMPRIADGDPAQALDALGEEVDELELLLGVLVEQQVELVEGRAGDEPVVLLVQAYSTIVSARISLRVGSSPTARFVGQADRQAAQGPEPLDLGRATDPGCGSGERGALVRPLRLSAHGVVLGRGHARLLRVRAGDGRSPHRGSRRSPSSRRASTASSPDRNGIARRGSRTRGLSAACVARTPRAARAPRAGPSGRTRSGSGCPRWPNCEPGSSSTPSASTSSAAQSSIRTPGTVSRGKPIEPARGRTQVKRSAQSSKKPSSRVEVGGHDRRASGASTRSRARRRDERQDLRRRRRADRRVVLERGAPGQQVAVVRRQPADPQPGQRERLRHDAERDARARARRRRPAGGRPRRTRGSGRPRRRGGGRRPPSASATSAIERRAVGQHPGRVVRQR